VLLCINGIKLWFYRNWKRAVKDKHLILKEDQFKTWNVKLYNIIESFLHLNAILGSHAIIRFPHQWSYTDMKALLCEKICHKMTLAHLQSKA